MASWHALPNVRHSSDRRERACSKLNSTLTQRICANRKLTARLNASPVSTLTGMARGQISSTSENKLRHCLVGVLDERWRSTHHGTPPVGSSPASSTPAVIIAARRKGRRERPRYTTSQG